MINFLVQRRQGQLAVVWRCVAGHGPPPCGCGQISLARQFRSRPAGGWGPRGCGRAACEAVRGSGSRAHCWSSLMQIAPGESWFPG